MQRITLRVPGLHCEGCISYVRLVVGGLGGVLNLDGDLKRKTLMVEYDPGLASPEAIIAQLDEIGFLAEPLGEP